MPRILWLRSHERTEEVYDFEQATGLSVAVSSGPPSSWKGGAHRVQVILIELPLETETVQQTLIEAQEAPIPLPVVIYDRESTLDESVIRPPMTAFRHVTGPLSDKELGMLVTGEIERSAQLHWDTARVREPWQDLLIGESQRDAGAARHDPAGGSAPVHGADHRRNRNRQGNGRAGDPHGQQRRAAARMVAVNCAAIPGKSGGSRAVRPRQRSLHRRRERSSRPLRTGPSRERFFWTKSARFRWRCSPNCCACFRSGSCSAWAARRPSRSTRA